MPLMGVTYASILAHNPTVSLDATPRRTAYEESPMAVIIRHKTSHIELVLLGPGYAAYMAMSQAGLVVDAESGELFKVAACDQQGRIHWLDAEDVEVVEVDGDTPSEVLRDRKRRASAS